jgi:hypothetical protein
MELASTLDVISRNSSFKQVAYFQALFKLGKQYLNKGPLT